MDTVMGKQWDDIIFKCVLWQNLCVPPRNFAFTHKKFAFPRETLAFSYEMFKFLAKLLSSFTKRFCAFVSLLCLLKKHLLFFLQIALFAWKNYLAKNCVPSQNLRLFSKLVALTRENLCDGNKMRWEETYFNAFVSKCSFLGEHNTFEQKTIPSHVFFHHHDCLRAQRDWPL